jgi:hypothetical protein
MLELCKPKGWPKVACGGHVCTSWFPGMSNYIPKGEWNVASGFGACNGWTIRLSKHKPPWRQYTRGGGQVYNKPPLGQDMKNGG